MKRLTIELNNGVKMPVLGLGVFLLEGGDQIKNAVNSALQTGYRSIDTTAMYKNESGVGEAVRNSNIPREEIFITTKVWNSDQGYQKTLDAFEKSREKLRTDFIDLYLIHWPVKGLYKETWQALEKLYENGDVRAIGVSNFQIHHLEILMSGCNIKPMVNQVEFHPLLRQQALQEFCKKTKFSLKPGRH